MTVFVGIINLTGSNLPSDEKLQVQRAFHQSCNNAPTYEESDNTSLVLSYCLNGKQENDFNETELSTLLLAGDPIIRNDENDITTEVVDINKADSQDELFAILTLARGVFSGVKRNKKLGSLSVFTDKLGIRPVYYYQKNGMFIFSSLISFFKNLSFVDLEIDSKGLYEKLAFGFCLGNKTEYKHIRRMNGAECIEIKERKVSFKTYWDWQHISVKKSVTEDDVKAAYQSFEQAVKVRLDQSGEAIAFLSGGLDSRVICAEVNKSVNTLHTFNFSTQRSQDNEFAKLFSEDAGLNHHEKQFETLAYPNWAQLIANEVKDNTSQIGENVDKGTVWSGDGGSVAVGNVYIDQNINDALMEGNTDEAINIYLDTTKISIPTRFLHRSISRQANQVLQKEIKKEFLKNQIDPAKEIYYFLMNNDQKRHLELHYETICQHKVELLLPFFDSDFLAKIYALPSSELLFHKFYMKWFKYFPDNAKNTPWQTYPKHEKCPVKFTGELSYQWDNSAVKKSVNRCKDFDVYLKSRKSPVFKKYFSAYRVFIAMSLHRLGFKNFSYLVKNLKQIDNLL